MRVRPLQLFFLSIFTIIFLLPYSMEAQNTVTFQVDMNGTDFMDGAEIGLRGSMLPLNWSTSLEMTDPDKDGIYTVSVDFLEGQAGDRVLYKYTANDKWDNDIYGPLGNRSLTLLSAPVTLPVDVWNTVGEFTFEALLEQAYTREMNLLIYMVGKAKIEGKKPESAMEDMVKFWGDDFYWIESPQWIMMMEKLRQAIYIDGYFEEIIDEPNEVKFMIYKPGTYYFGNRTTNGSFKGVSQKDLVAIEKYFMEAMAKAKGWELIWEEKPNHIVITIKS